MSIRDIAVQMIKGSDYLSLATVDGDSPWVAPLFFACDENFNLYFVSRKDTRHSLDIYKNPKVSFCIFNSEDKDFTAQGLQASGLCIEASVRESLIALRHLYHKKHPEIKDMMNIKVDLKSVTGMMNDRVYKIIPEHIFVLDPKNPDMDRRIEVKL